MLKVSTSTTVLSKVVVLYVPVVVTKVKVRTRTCVDVCAARYVIGWHKDQSIHESILRSICLTGYPVAVLTTCSTAVGILTDHGTTGSMGRVLRAAVHGATPWSAGPIRHRHPVTG